MSTSLLTLTLIPPAVCVTHTLLALFLTGVWLYLPYHLAFVVTRAKYYLLGQENPEVGVAQSIHQLVANWRWNDTSTRFASIVEL